VTTTTFLLAALGPHLTARLSTPEQREAARKVFTRIADAECAETACAWLVGMNPALCDRSPISAIRCGEFDAVLAAADRYLTAT
jgi:hypothetical protein